MSNPEFKAWPKIPRTIGNVLITEKIDGTNGCVVIQGDEIYVQSRKRFITPDDDNFGFAAWVQENRDDLLSLGDGYHYGEWAGPGIQKNPHGLEKRHFFLFNCKRWGDHNPSTPACCSVVPLLYEGKYYDGIVAGVMDLLSTKYLYSEAVPEGVIVYFCALKSSVKYTFNSPNGKYLEE